MISQKTREARMRANQANSQLSTGPATPEGKAASSRNSFKHGLCSKQLVIPGEDPAELDALKASLFAEHQPACETEAILVNEMAEQFWRIRRARAFEANLLQAEFNLSHMNAAQRLMSSAERGFHKALKTLRELQKARGFVPQNQVASGADLRTAMPAAVPAPESLGFVLQNGPQTATAQRARMRGTTQVTNSPSSLGDAPDTGPVLRGFLEALNSEPRSHVLSTRRVR